MDSKEIESKYSGQGRLRLQNRRRVLILGATVVLIVCWKVEPRVEDRVLLYLAEQAVVNDRLSEAQERLEVIITEEPGQAWPRFLRAQVARKRGNLTEAEEDLQRAIELGLPIELARGEHALLVEQTVSDRPSTVSPERAVASGGATERK
jgi:predicted Zn-dependent protease